MVLLEALSIGTFSDSRPDRSSNGTRILRAKAFVYKEQMAFNEPFLNKGFAGILVWRSGFIPKNVLKSPQTPATGGIRVWHSH
jgi:hypothetical protein